MSPGPGRGELGSDRQTDRQTDRTVYNNRCHLGQVGMRQGLLSGDPPVWVNLQHGLQEVDSHGVGAREHLVELLLLHLGQRVDVVLGLDTRDLVHGLLGRSPA